MTLTRTLKYHVHLKTSTVCDEMPFSTNYLSNQSAATPIVLNTADNISWVAMQFNTVMTDVCTPSQLAHQTELLLSKIRISIQLSQQSSASTPPPLDLSFTQLEFYHHPILSIMHCVKSSLTLSRLIIQSDNPLSSGGLFVINNYRSTC